MAKEPVFSGYYKNPETANLRMDIYAYNPPTNGDAYFDGKLYKDEKDFRTVEQYRTYKDCGFDVLLLQSQGAFGDETWEQSDAKKAMDTCRLAGMEKVVLRDTCLYELSKANDGVIGEGKPFANENALDAFVQSRMQNYSKHPAFFGVELAEKLAYTQLKALGQVYKSIKRVCPKAFIHVNLATMAFGYGEGVEPPYGESFDYNKRYEAYINVFFEETGADHVLAAMIPYEEGWSEGLYIYFFRQWQILAKVAAERGAQLHATAQAWGAYVNGKLAFRCPNRQEMNLQMHALMGMGAKKIVFKQYWSQTENELLGEYSPNGWAIVKANGEPAPLYEEVQLWNSRMHKLAPVMMNFAFVASNYAAVSPFVSKPMHIKFTLRNQLKNAEIETSHELAMAYELYDEKRAQYLYVVQNITCPLFGKNLPKQTSKISFNNKAWTKVDVFDGSEWRTEELVDGTYTVELENGDAVYLLPY